MTDPYRAEITIREPQGKRSDRSMRIDSREINSKQDILDMINKYGDVILKLKWEELLEVWNVPIMEVEEYVRRKRSERYTRGRTRKAIKK